MKGKWHTRIQSMFPNYMNEIYSDDKKNIADVLNKKDKIVLEVQDSLCNNCFEKSKAWNERGYDIVWIFNGISSDTQKCLDISTCQKIVTMTKEISELIVFIYVDDENVYPIQTKSFKKYTANVRSITLATFVESFMNGTINNIKPCIEKTHVSIRQDPPGSGKTYTMTRDAIDRKQYKTIIILCQHHAPNAVIKNQIMEHTGWEPVEYNKAFKFKQDDRTIIIATMDSLMYVLSNGESDKRTRSIFSGMAQTIAQTGIKTSPTGICNLKSESTRFCCKTWVIVDEATKTPAENYMEALHALICESGADLHICGDVLQSTNDSENLMKVSKKYFGNMENIVLDFMEGNTIRRFGHAGTDLLNRVIPYEKLRVQRPIPHESAPNDTDIFCHKFTVKNVINRMKDDINELNLQAKDIMILCIPTYEECFIDLHEKINNVHCLDEVQSEFMAYLHKSEEGKPVDLSLSDEGTRMVSIHTSQGDGRKLVYVCGISHKNIDRYVRDAPDHDLKYWSFVNVALSRMKRRMRIFISKFDELTERFSYLIPEHEKIDLYNEHNLRSIRINSNNTYDFCDLQLIKNLRETNTFENVKRNDKKMSEITDHTFARMVFYYKVVVIFSKIDKKYEQRLYCRLSQEITNIYKERREKIYIPRYKSKIETYKRIIQYIQKIKTSKQVDKSVESICILTYVMFQQEIEPYKLFEVFEKRKVLIDLIQPILEFSEKSLNNFINYIEEDIVYVSTNHLICNDNDMLNISGQIPILISTKSKIYCIYPVQSLDKIFTEKVIIRSYVDKCIIANCEIKDRVVNKLRFNSKTVHSYLYSLSCGTISEINPLNKIECANFLHTHIESKYVSFFHTLYEMYMLDFSDLSKKKEDLTETWIKDIIGSATVDAEDNEIWSKDKFIRKLNNKLTKILTEMNSPTNAREK